MAILKIINYRLGKRANLKGIINYVLKKEKTEKRLVTGLYCEIPKALETMLDTKMGFDKMNGRPYYHAVQSFPPIENITPEQAHEIGVEVAKRWKKFRGFEMIVSTHIDRGHIHNHYVWNSVNFVDGKKFHITRQELEELKQLQNQICIDHGFMPAPKKGFDMFGNQRTEVTANDSKTYRVLKKAKAKEKDSYILNCKEALLNAVKMAADKNQFVKLMKAQGFKVDWTQKRKHITFTDLNRKKAGEKKCKVRVYKLAQYFPELINLKSKEDLLNELTKKNLKDVRGLTLTAVNTNKSAVGADSAEFDFNSEFEKYSANIDSERRKSAASEVTGRKQESDRSEQKRLQGRSRTFSQRNSKAGRKLRNTSKDIPGIGM